MMHERNDATTRHISREVEKDTGAIHHGHETHSASLHAGAVDDAPAHAIIREVEKADDSHDGPAHHDISLGALGIDNDDEDDSDDGNAISGDDLADLLG